MKPASLCFLLLCSGSLPCFTQDLPGGQLLGPTFEVVGLEKVRITSRLG